MKSTKHLLFTVAFFLALSTGSAFAHGNKVHVRGTVEKISADSVFVKTADGKSVEVKVAQATVYVMRISGEDKPAKLADLAVGDAVVIHATSKDSSLTADEVKFTAPSASKPASSAPTGPKP